MRNAFKYKMTAKTNNASLRGTGTSVLVIVAVCVSLVRAAAIARGADDPAQKLAEGKRLFHARCGYCHLAGGTGTIMLARRLGKDRALLEERTDLSLEYIKKITRVGINGMPPHNRIELPDSELDLIALYLTRPASVRAADSPKSQGGAP
jgi:mono/diheme cytochrome c family protein